MKAVAAVGLGLFVVSIVALAGCRHKVVYVEREESPPPQRVVVVEEAAPDAYVVQEAPPPLVVEEYGPAPEVGMVWIGGYYTYHAHHYVWARGHWDRPPHRGAHWESHRWVHERGGYHYYPGRWR